ncbi:MAG: nucleoside deaminase [Ruminococcaceae bacterium]|nr:nucleoside deaminase [Oscillospiraceae bacterium]
MSNPFMTEALLEAKKAAALGEVPVGTVLVKDNTIICRAHNQSESGGTILAHAELIVLAEALKKLGTKRLTGCSLYVTMEPCPMCAGAISLAAPDRVYFGAYDALNGACGGKLDLFQNSHIEVYGGIMEQDCKELLQRFFAERRQK